MNLVFESQLFNLAKVLLYDGFSFDLSYYASKIDPNYSSLSLVVTVEKDERMIKIVENKIMANLGCNYKITQTDGKKYTSLLIAME